MDRMREALTALDAALTGVADLNPAFLSTADKSHALTQLAAIEARVGELRFRVMASASDLAEQGADRNLAGWLVRTQRVRRADAAADVRLAAALDRHRHRLADALQGGFVNVDQARVIVAALGDLPARVGEEVVEKAELALIEYAAEFGPTELARLGQRILDVVAPEVADAEEARRLERLEAQAAERQRLTLRSLGDGTTRLSAVVPDATAARLATYLHAFTSPRQENGEPRNEISEDRPEGGAVGGMGAAYPRRLAQAFGQLLECLDPTRLPLHGGDATTLTVTVQLESLRKDLATATFDVDVPGDGLDSLTAAQTRRLACTAKIIPAVLGADSEVLDLGRARRLFTPAQRKALLVRDKRCRAAGCDIPGTWCEAHHLTPWSAGGGTDLANSVLLCSHHHHRVHDPAWEHERNARGDLIFRKRLDRRLTG